MRTVILEKLTALEREFDIRILFSCESGSRAWGFASPDSDFDIRFIYAHRSDFYLSVDDPRDVVELPVNEVLDVNGWELRKALRLFRKSNAPIYEWLQSPIVYRAVPGFIEDMHVLMPRYFSPRAAMHHYLSMTRGIFKSDLAERDIKLKKYCYALRTSLACRWIADRMEVPPMTIDSLRTVMHDDLSPLVDDLLRQKAVADERRLTDRIEALNDYIASQIAFCEGMVPAPHLEVDNEPLNNIFRKYIV